MAEGGNGNGSVSRWGAIASLIGAAAVVLGSMFVLYARGEAAYSTANDLKDRVDRLSLEIVADRTTITKLCASVIETETQFKSSDQMRNILHKDDLNHIAMLWHRAYKEDMPTADTYLPTIAQDRPDPCG